MMLKTDKIFFDGGTFITSFKNVDILYNLWNNKIIEFLNKNIIDDDQNIILQIYFLIDLTYLILNIQMIGLVYIEIILILNKIFLNLDPVI